VVEVWGADDTEAATDEAEDDVMAALKPEEPEVPGVVELVLVLWEFVEIGPGTELDVGDPDTDREGVGLEGEEEAGEPLEVVTREVDVCRVKDVFSPDDAGTDAVVEVEPGETAFGAKPVQSQL
jgi:hypothetical protein